jgi:hypothetical protein
MRHGQEGDAGEPSKVESLLVVGIAIIIFAPAATLRLLDEGSPRCKIVKAVKTVTFLLAQSRFLLTPQLLPLA